MILDKTTLFSDGQAITATAGSDNTIDLGAVGTILGAAGAMPFDFGKGSKIPLLVQVTQTFTNLTSLKIDVELDSTTSFRKSLVSKPRIPPTLAPSTFRMPISRVRIFVV